MGCALFPLQKIVFRSNQGAMDMEEYVYRENVALFKKRLAEAHTSEAQSVNDPEAPNDNKAFLSQLALHQSLQLSVSDFGL